MDEVCETTAYHLVFNWHSSEIVPLITRVAANLRALGYTVVDDYQSELVVLPGVGFDINALEAALAKVDVIIIPNGSEVTHEGRYGFCIKVCRVSYSDRHLRFRLADPSAQTYQLLGHFLTIEGDQNPGIMVRAYLLLSNDELTAWKLEGGGVTGDPTVIKVDDGTAHLVFGPDYNQLKRYQSEGHQPVRLEEIE